MDRYRHMLLVSDPLREPALLAAMQALGLPEGSHGLDAGCGIGLQAIRLAEKVGKYGHVTGLDASPDFVCFAHEHAEQMGLSHQLSFLQGDWNELPFETGAFDWAWSADGVGYAAREPLQEIKQLARVVKTGGTVAILMWSSQLLLPGYPALEARLNATRVGIAPFDMGAPVECHYTRALGWLRAARLRDVRAETFVRSVYAPLSDELRDALAALLEMRWGGAEAELSKLDQLTYRRLCQHDSPEFILNLPDYYAFCTYTMFTGIVRAPGYDPC